MYHFPFSISHFIFSCPLFLYLLDMLQLSPFQREDVCVFINNILFFFFNKFIYLFIYLFLAVLGLRFCARAFSSCGEQGPLFIAVRGPLTVVASHCGAEAPDAQAQQLWHMGLVAPRHVGSSRTRARTRVPCIGRQTPNHCATREAQYLVLMFELIQSCF